MRRRHQVFGRGTIEFLESGNPRILAFARRYAEETIVVAANLARSAQQAAIGLPPSAVGLAAVELTDGVRFPSIGPLPYTLTFEAHGWHWLQVVASPAVSPAGTGARPRPGVHEGE